MIPQPNYFGALEQVDDLVDLAHKQGCLVIAVVNPLSLAILKAPGEWGENGADIVVGEGQPLGIPLSSGGPYFGFMCCTQKIVRQMPGRLIGRTVDAEGKAGVYAHITGPGAAHTPLQSDIEHLYQPGPDGHCSNICTCP